MSTTTNKKRVWNPFRQLTKKNKSELDLLNLELRNLESSDEYSDQGEDYSQLVHLEEGVDVSAPSDESQDTTLTVQTLTPTAKSQQDKTFPIHWMFLALISHTGWGIYPVLARYLQTVSQLPSMSLLITGNGLVSIVTLVIVIKRGRLRAILNIKALPIMIFVTVIRATTNLVSPKFTLAIYVQLMTLMAPFLVAIFNTLFLKEELPPRTVPAMLSAFVGAALMLFSQVFPFKMAVSGTDIIGIALAFVSACFLALYMILIKKTTAEQSVSGEELLFFLTAPIVLVASIFSIFLEEDWGPWKNLSPAGWIIFTVFAGGILLFGNLLQISSIRFLGAPMVSTMIAFRLVSAGVASAIILDEKLSDALQLMGAFIVLSSITLYMWVQYRSNKKKKQAAMALALSTSVIESVPLSSSQVTPPVVQQKISLRASNST